MTGNPELRRNVWLQLSAQRLVAAPVVLGIVFGLAYVTSNDPAAVIALIARWGFLLFALLWGTRRAADSVAEEVNTGTWDGQRMGALGAWTMAWGKLVGSTVYTWYCGLICLAVYAVARSQEAAAPDGLALAADLVLLIEAALIGQVVAMAFSLAMWRKRMGRRPLRWAAGQMAGIVAGAGAALRLDFLPDPPAAADAMAGLLPAWQWYGLSVDLTLFRVLSVAVFCAWGMLAIYRLMRQELQYRTWPWAWTLFVLFCLAYVGGFTHTGNAILAPETGSWQWASPAWAVVMVYAALFVEPKSMIAYRQFLGAARRGDGERFLGAMPLWLPTYVIAAVTIVAAIVFGDREHAFQRITTPATAAAQLLFMLRDIAFVLALNFGRNPGRADLPAFIYLVIAYMPLGWLLMQTEQPLAVALVLPVPSADPLVTLGPVAVELILVLGFLWFRWNRYGVPRVAGTPMKRVAAAGA